MAKRVIQRHHISYTPEWIVPMYQGEHQLITKLYWYSKKTVSQGLITALKDFINKNELRAINLEDLNEEKKING